jgi:hypothetical protein
MFRRSSLCSCSSFDDEIVVVSGLQGGGSERELGPVRSHDT